MRVKLSDLDLLKFGNTIGMVGVIYAGEGQAYMALFPEERDLTAHLETLDMDLDEWRQLMSQLDSLETEVTARAADGTIQKAILRKSARNIEAGVSWQVFRRDNYTCRYCGKNDVPLTVDHVVCWEEGGPSIPENLVTACRKCNKARGNTPYAAWLDARFYRDVSTGRTAPGVSATVRADNEALVAKLDQIPRLNHIKKRG